MIPRQAIDRSEVAFREWRVRSAKERADLIHAWAANIEKHADYLAQLVTAEGGKPILEARGEVNYGW